MLKITVLIENFAPDHLICEHGLSLHLEYNGHFYLLDGGTTGIFTENARRLGIDLTRVEGAALSHGHDDHGDGLGAFFRCNPAMRVCARQAAVEPRYMEDDQGNPFYVGVSQELLHACMDRFDLDDGPRLLAPGLHLIPDSVDHEQSLVAETDQGLVVMNSCCHAGVDHIVRDILDRFPGQQVYAVVGGFHLVGKHGMGSLGVDPETVTSLSRRLVEELGVERIYTGHCTGLPARQLLSDAEPGHVFPLRTGDVLVF